MKRFDMTARFFLTPALVLALAWILPPPASAQAGDSKWSLRLEGFFAEVSGHDQHVLTVREGGAGRRVNLDSGSELIYRLEARYRRGGRWAWGVDFSWLTTPQNAGPLTAVGAGPASAAVFEIAGRGFASTGPGEVLFFEVLEDTDINAWTADLYGLRTWREGPRSAVRLQLGVRAADFDNDYRAVVGVEGVEGTRLDASSNYSLMLGPIVGVVGEMRRGKSLFEGYLGQSVVFGSPELTSRQRDFLGPVVPEEQLTVVSQRIFQKDESATIPITEARLRWAYEISRAVSVGLGANASVWWNVPVPPGVVPGLGGLQALHESTLKFFGLTASVGVSF